MVLTPKKIVDGHYEMWIPGEGTLNPGTGFLRPVSKDDTYKSGNRNPGNHSGSI